MLTTLVIIALVISKKKANAMSVEKKGPTGGKMKILASQVIRIDAAGNGNYGRSRTGHKHMGVDLIAKPGESIFAPEGGKVVKIGLAYSGDSRYNSYHIALDSGLRLKLLYVKPHFKLNDRVQAGQVIATSQDIAGKYGASMINHVHVEIISNGFTIDPTKFLI